MREVRVVSCCLPSVCSRSVLRAARAQQCGLTRQESTCCLDAIDQAGAPAFVRVRGARLCSATECAEIVAQLFEKTIFLGGRALLAFQTSRRGGFSGPGSPGGCRRD